MVSIKAQTGPANVDGSKAMFTVQYFDEDKFYTDAEFRMKSML